jgi:copper homeostasis protein
MGGDIEIAKRLGAHGVVVGILHPDGTVDVDRMKELVGLARPLSVTFHRAFDDAIKPVESIEEVVRTGAERLLTSGQQARAENGLPLIAQLSALVSGRLKLIAAAGIGRDNIHRIAALGRVNEIHVATAVRNNASGEVDADLVRTIIAEVARV